MGNFAILDDGLPYSSLTGRGLAALGLWALILATKDRDGITSLTPEVVARLTREPVEVVREKWSILTDVDHESRNPSEDGRRLVQLSDGRWRVVSNELYRERHTGAERRRVQNREAQRRHRARVDETAGLDGVEGHAETTLRTDAGRHSAESRSNAVTGNAGKAQFKSGPAVSPAAVQRRAAELCEPVSPPEPSGRAAQPRRTEEGHLHRSCGPEGLATQPRTKVGPEVEAPPFDAPGGRQLPIVAGRRAELEAEWHALVREVSALAGEDPLKTAADAGQWKGRDGRTHTKLNSAAMSDDHLARTVLNLRARQSGLVRRDAIAAQATKAATRLQVESSRVSERDARKRRAFVQALEEAAHVAGQPVDAFKLAILKDSAAKRAITSRRDEILAQAVLA